MPHPEWFQSVQAAQERLRSWHGPRCKDRSRCRCLDRLPEAAWTRSGRLRKK